MKFPQITISGKPDEGGYAHGEAWNGISKTFISAGFSEIVRHSPTRPVMMLELN